MYTFIALIILICLYFIVTDSAKSCFLKCRFFFKKRSFQNTGVDIDKMNDMVTKLQPVLNEAEKNRRNMFILFLILVALIPIAIVLYSLYGVPHMYITESGDLGGVVFIGYVALGLLPVLPFYLYKSHYRKQVLPLLAEAINYTHNAPKESAWVQLAKKEGNLNEDGRWRGIKSSLFGSFNGIDTGECFSGAYQDKRIVFEQIKLTQGQAEDGDKTVFKGFLVCMDSFPKNKTHMIIHCNVVSPPQNLLTDMVPVQMDNTQYPKNIVIYAMNPFSAQNAIKPLFLEKLTDISLFYNSAPVMAAFYDEKVFIAVQLGGDLFEPASFFTDARSKRNIELILAQIELQHQVVDSLGG